MAVVVLYYNCCKFVSNPELLFVQADGSMPIIPESSRRGPWVQDGCSLEAGKSIQMGMCIYTDRIDKASKRLI